MNGTVVGIIAFASLLALLIIRIPVAFAMFAVGLVGISIMNSPQAAITLLGTESYTLATSNELIVVPLFILMGNVASRSGMSRALYDAAYAWIGSLRGGLAAATVLGCASFAALSGSSIASALTIGKVSLGEMSRFGYGRRLSTGTVAAGGTLGILIPPSTGFVVYAILTQESIGRLFLAGVIPGLLLATLFIVAIWIMCVVKPEIAPVGPTTSWPQRMAASLGALPVLAVILLTIGGIYLGFFSPIEAAAVGAALMFAIAMLQGTLSGPDLKASVRETVVTTTTVILILISASVLNPFIALTHIPRDLGAFLEGLDIGRYGVLLLILACYLILGCFLDGLSMIVLTMPIFYPIILALGFDPIWYGVIVVVILEMAMISPPVGVNAFIVKSVAPDVPLREIFIGILPFWAMMILLVIILMLFPQIATYLPDHMIG